MTEPWAPACAAPLNDSEVAVIAAVTRQLWSSSQACNRPSTLADTAVFRIKDPSVWDVPLDWAWDIGRLDLDASGLSFRSDDFAFAIRFGDIEEVRVAGQVAIVSKRKPSGQVIQVGLGGYPAYAAFIAFSVNATRWQFTPAERRRWLTALRDSVLENAM